MATDNKKSGGLVENFLSLFSGQYPLDKLTATDASTRPNKTLYTTAERDRLLTLAKQAQPVQPTNTGVDPEAYFGALSRKGITDTLDNERIIQMAPEISLAASIMIPSILSPNDMRAGVINIVCDGGDITEDQKSEISSYLTTLFESRLNLSTMLPKWIYQAMYRAGATPLLVLPLKTLMDEMDDKSQYIETASTEAISEMADKFASTSEFGFAQTTNSKTYTASLESLCAPVLSAAFQDKDAKRRVTENAKSTEALQSLIGEICSTEALTIIDNPNAVTLPKVKNAATARKNSGKTRRYLEADTYAFPDAQSTDMTDLCDNPIWWELPAEAVIPIFTPGTPADHLGYFVVMDENGHPIDAGATRDNNLASMAGPSNYANSQRSNQFYNLFQSYGFTRNEMYDRVPERDVMEHLYQSIVEHHLTAKTMEAGYANVGLGDNGPLYRAMLTRFLQQKRTRLLFVPKEFMTYFCFRHSRNGTGVSKLDDLKWILSLRISLLVARMISAFKNSIDKKRLTINLADTHVSNVNQHMRTALQQAISKDMWSFSYNPSDVAALIAERSYSIDLTGVQGIADYKIASELDTRPQSSQPDNELANDIKNMEYLGLEVPPSVLNNLSEAEFSRSVATTNIIFSRRLSVYQKIVAKYLGAFIQNYCRYSKEITTAIKAIVDPSNKSTGVKNDGNVSDNKAARGVDVGAIINSIKIVLPDPTMAPDSAQFDTLNSALQSFQTISNQVFPDELAGGDATISAAIGAARAIFNTKLITNHVRKSGLSEDTVDCITDGIDDNEIIKMRQTFISIASAFTKQNAVFKPVLSTPDDTGTGGDMGGSGYDTGTGGMSDNDFSSGDQSTGDAGDDTGDNTSSDTGTDDTGSNDLISDDTTVTSSSTSSDQSGGPTGQSLV